MTLRVHSGQAGRLLVLSRADIAGLMGYADYVDAVEAAFRLAADGCAVAPPASALHVPDGSFHAKGAALLGDPAVVAIKLNGNFPENPARCGLPTVQGVIYLADAANGRPLALMDSIEITINRTGAATTLAARHLARPDSRVATICGAGVQGRIQAHAIAAALPLQHIHVWDCRPEVAARLARSLGAELGLDVTATATLETARDSDVVVTCTSAREAYLTRDLVAPGTFIAAVGADNSDKQEIDPALYAASCAVVDSLEQAAEIGDLHHALAVGALTLDRVHARLGELVAGRKPGRRGDREITLFDSTGMGLQDIAAAAAVYRRAVAAGVGTRLEL
ncbi:MAG: ornithine cyclodeaminase family protein [Reyranella sp.]|uniref:ornithine cyclodeaminase family protein n=1 Tax=Reyranella sp. TaxID=1929291 RepID=UPI003D0E5F15